MRLEHPDLTAAKGWYAGPWNSDLPIAIGYANAGVDEPHVHTQLTKIYLVARGTSEIRKDGPPYPHAIIALCVFPPVPAAVRARRRSGC